MPLALPPLPDNGGGVTPSAPLNTAIGGSVIGASNAATLAIGGPEIPLLAAGLTMLFQDLKHISFYDQQKYARITLLVLAIGISVALALWVSHTDVVQAITRGCGVAAQAHINWAGAKLGGIPGFPGAAPIKDTP